MGKEKPEDPDYNLDEEQVRTLIDLGKITKQSVNSMIKEGIEMYIKFKRGESAQPMTLFSPIVFDPPYPYRKPEE